jgi:ADP-ribosyl-[dinitrogen reductase] hydrolase
LLDFRELFAQRASGNTCISALESGAMGTIEKPINDSKGCGGVMRAAPVGMLY